MLGEPKGALLGRAVEGVRAMANVASELEAKVSANGAGQRGSGVGLTQNHSSDLDGVGAHPDHGTDRSAGKVFAQVVVKALAGQISVVLLCLVNSGLNQLQSHKLQAASLETLDDLSDKSSLDAVRPWKVGKKE